MTAEYNVISYAEEGKVTIGTTSTGEDGAVRVFMQLWPIDGVFYMVPKKRVKNGKTINKSKRLKNNGDLEKKRKHTSGPWIDNGCGGIYGFSEVVQGDEESGQLVGLCTVYNTQANACLIAAAPDLLEALEEMYADKGACLAIISEKARLAIAKAKGTAA